MLQLLVMLLVACGGETKEPRSAAPPVPPPPVVATADAAIAITEAVDAAIEITTTSKQEGDCKAKLSAMGLDHGSDACKPKPPAAPLADAVQQLPKKCAADSPEDKPCSAYGGVYKVRLEPDPAAPCFGKKAIETTIRLKADATYKGSGPAASEALAGLLRATTLRDKEPLLGSAVRDGVCCVDIDVIEQVKGKYRRLVLRMASGASVVNAKASIGCDDSGDRTDLKVTVTRSP